MRSFFLKFICGSYQFQPGGTIKHDLKSKKGSSCAKSVSTKRCHIFLRLEFLGSNGTVTRKNTCKRQLFGKGFFFVKLDFLITI